MDPGSGEEVTLAGASGANAAAGGDRAPAIRLDGVVHRYGKTEALKGISLAVPRGIICGLVGSNGAGKTTTLKILATLLRPTAGRVELLGGELPRTMSEARRRIGYMPDFFGVYQDLEVTEYLEFFAAAYGLRGARRRQVVGDVLELTGLAGKRGHVIGSLSRGMQQRLGLARVLVHDPALLLLDEPASGLDPRARVEVAAILGELRGMGKTILISSHILHELEEMCDMLAIIESGRLLFTGTLAELRASVGGGLRQVRLEIDEPGELERRLRELPQVAEVEPVSGGGWRVVLGADGAWDVPDLAAWLVGSGYRVRRLEPNEPNLQEVFMLVTKGEVA